jgi:ATP-dependent RNA helicase SUPV3L1/SUV3
MEQRHSTNVVAALKTAISDAGLTVLPHEMLPLLNAIDGRPPASGDALRKALVRVRRLSWRSQLAVQAQREALPASPDDLDLAVSAIAEPEPREADLLEALRRAILVRLRGFGTPEAALAEAGARQPEEQSDGRFLEAVERCAGLVAEAFSMAEDSAGLFIRDTVEAERRRQEERRRVTRVAQETRAREEHRLRRWEASLVGGEAVPGLLGCSRQEAELWIWAGMVPVARQVEVRRGGQTWREAEFDPATLEALRSEVAVWREADTSGRPAPADTSTGMRPTSNAAVARAAGLDHYAAHFARARAMTRHITACLGPTNSGKTHFGLSRLAEADSGIALGPLRLLAHEYRDALEARGIPTALSTGEERIQVPGSRHTAATVEMCPFQKPVDVAVIDEAQMLADPERGSAWTAALMGVPARHVIVLGAPDAAAMIRRIAALCGDSLEELRLERMGPLAAAPKPVPLTEIGPGDAVIAFSRREVFALRAELQRRGRSVAVVYGALGPTVRRAEAKRFREGEAEVLVATDAIGMGLNIGPLRRVVFSALTKWDGKQERPLSVQEIKQIGGRAGRFGGEHAEGIVAVLEGGGDPKVITHALGSAPEAPEDLRPPVAPDAEIVAAVAAEIGTDSLFDALRRIERAVLRRDDPNYRLGDLSTQMAIAMAVDRVRELSLLDRWTYALCPVDERDEGIERLTDWAVEHAMGRVVPPPQAGRLPPPHRAGQEALQVAERVHRRLIAWRWMALRFPATYEDVEAALAESRRLNDWIEAVLAARPSGRLRAVSGGATAVFQKKKGLRQGFRGAAPRKFPGYKRRRGA